MKKNYEMPAAAIIVFENILADYVYATDTADNDVSFDSLFGTP